MKNYIVEINGKTLSAGLISKNGNVVKFECNNQVYDVKISPDPEIFSARGSSNQVTASIPVKQQKTHSSGDIVAPMPGIIVSIQAKEGDSVAIGQTLLVMEAMKMENNIASTKDGIVKKIHVKAGEEVSNSQVLVSVG